jgi:aminoglycoside phosphotransferase (APT) family kinase protein
MTHTPSLTLDDLRAICRRAFPERPIQDIDFIAPLHSRQHEMIAFDLRWTGRSAEYVEPLVVRRYVSTLSWWRPDDRGKAQREVTVMRWLHQQGMPVSVMYAREFGALGDVVLFSRLPGEDWSAEGRPFPAVALEQAGPFAWLLAKLHSLSPPDEVKAVVPLVTLPSVLATLTALAAQIGQPELDTAVQKAMAHAYDIQENPPVLLHGDYHLSNVLIANGQISGIIDWEYTALGDPRWDLANAYIQMVDFDAAEAADAFLSAYLENSGRTFEGPPLYNAVTALQQWVISEWLVRQGEEGNTPTFALARHLIKLRDVHQRRALQAMRWMDE